MYFDDLANLDILLLDGVPCFVLLVPVIIIGVIKILWLSIILKCEISAEYLNADVGQR